MAPSGVGRSLYADEVAAALGTPNWQLLEAQLAAELVLPDPNPLSIHCIVLPFRDTELNAARWLRDIELRWPCSGSDRRNLALFCQADGQPFTDSRFSSLVHTALVLGVGEARASVLTPHAWRVWIASALRMCGAADPLIMALGRWLNPPTTHT